jgi:hypothetical protein
MQGRDAGMRVEGVRSSGPRERMVLPINDAGRTLCYPCRRGLDRRARTRSPTVWLTWMLRNHRLDAGGEGDHEVEPAAGRGIWTVSELRTMLADRDMAIGADRPNAVKLADLDVICAVLGCEAG